MVSRKPIRYFLQRRKLYTTVNGRYIYYKQDPRGTPLKKPELQIKDMMNKSAEDSPSGLPPQKKRKKNETSGTKFKKGPSSTLLDRPISDRAEEFQAWFNAAALDALAFDSSDLPYRPYFDFVPSGKKLAEHDLDACFHIIEDTSSEDYRRSSIGWQPLEKKREMVDENMMYLLVRRPRKETEISSADEDEILGFMSFMFTKDDPPYAHRDVVYIYEIHLTEPLRGKGLGSHLINIVDAVAIKAGITKTMLTVFTRNVGARQLYERLGYSKDQCSPPARQIRKRVIEPDYIIMSKELKRAWQA